MNETSKHDREWLVEFAGMSEKVLAQWDADTYPAAWDPWYAAVQTVREECGADPGGDEDMPTPVQAVRQVLVPLSNALYDGGIHFQNEYSVTVKGLETLARDCLEAQAKVKTLEKVLRAALAASGCDGDLCNFQWHEDARDALGGK